MRLWIPVLWLIAGALVGGILGWSGVLCGNGTCSLTGSLSGGVMFGGLVGLAVAGRGCPTCAFRPQVRPGDHHAPTYDS